MPANKEPERLGMSEVRQDVGREVASHAAGLLERLIFLSDGALAVP